MVKKLVTLYKDNGGNVTIFSAIFLSAIIAVAGAAIDFGMAFMVKSKIQSSSDIAAVAVASLSNDSDTADVRQTVLNRYYSLNFPTGYYGVTRPSAAYIDNPADRSLITVKSSDVTLNSYFLSNLNNMTVNASTRVQVKSDPASSTKHDVILVMDTSGSMVNGFNADFILVPQRIYTMRDMALKMTQELLDKSTNPLLDNRIASNNWEAYLMGSHHFTNDYTEFSAYLNDTLMDTKLGTYGTDSSVGMAKAKAMAAGFRPDAARIVVFMTDGMNNYFNYPAITPNATDLSNAATLAICDDLKAMDPPVRIYTVAMSKDVYTDPRVFDMLSKCASDYDSSNPDANKGTTFFIAPDAVSFSVAFDSITDSIKHIVIVP